MKCSNLLKLISIWLILFDAHCSWNTSCLNSDSDASLFVSNVTLGMAIPLSGHLSEVPPLVPIIKRKMKALDLYRRWVNNCKGGLTIGGLKYGIEVVFLDDEGNSEKTANRTAELIDDYGANFIFPSITPPLEVAGLEVGEARKIITMQETELEHCMGYTYCFSTRTHIGEMMESVIKALVLRGATNLVYFGGGQKNEKGPPPGEGGGLPPSDQGVQDELGGDEAGGEGSGSRGLSATTLTPTTFSTTAPDGLASGEGPPGDGPPGEGGPPNDLEVACANIPNLVSRLPKNLQTIEVAWGHLFPTSVQHPEIISQIKAEVDVGIDIFIGCTAACDVFIPLMKAMSLDANAIIFPKCIDDGKHLSLGEDAMYLLGPSQWDAKMGYECSITGATAQTFSEAFEELYGLDPSGTGAASFAGALALGEAAQNAGSLDSDDILYEMSRLDVDSMFGTLKFNNLNMIDEEMAFHQIGENLEEHVVIPEGVATGSLIYPMKVWSVRECELEYGEGNCVCEQDGCPACTSSDYEYVVTDCNPETELRYLQYHKINSSECEGGLDTPDDFKTTCDYLPSKSSTASSIYAISVIGAFLGSVYFLWFLINWKQRVVMLSQPVFCLLYTFFGTVFSLSTILFLGRTTTAKCILREWVFHLSFTGMVGSLLVKVYRVWRIFGMKALRKVKVSAAMMLRALSVMLSVDILLLLLLSVVRAPKAIIYYEDITNVGMIPVTECRPAFTFSTALIFYKIAIVVVACYFSYQIRNVDSHFSETKYIMFAIYSIALVLGISFLVMSQDVTIQLKLLLQGFGVSFSSMMALSAVAIPKVVIHHLRGVETFFTNRTATDGVGKSVMSSPSQQNGAAKIGQNSHELVYVGKKNASKDDEEKDFESLYYKALKELNAAKEKIAFMEKEKSQPLI